jgi:16S rRNA processing protein RimM
MTKEVVSKSNKDSVKPLLNGANDGLVALAKIGRPYGLTGAMHVFPYSTDAATFRRAKSIVVRGKTHTVASLRPHGEAYVMLLEGVATPELAQTFTNAEVFVSRDAFPPLPKGEFYWVDLVGLDCTNGERHFGKIVEVFEAGAHPILRVRDEQNTAQKEDELIPFVDAIIRSVDLDAKRVDVDWEGLE